MGQIVFNAAVRNALQSDVVNNVKIDIMRTVDNLNEEGITVLGERIARNVNYNGKIYLTGIGKPSFVAMKNAMTLKSIEVNAEYLDACTAGHGDLGSMPVNDVLVIAMSKSGKSSELLTLFKNLNSCRPNADIILVTFSNDAEALRELYKDIEHFEIISLNVDPKEFDGYGLIPSSSNIGFEAALSIAFAFAMKVLGPDEDLWHRLQRSHPSGTLQTKITNIINNKK